MSVILRVFGISAVLILLSISASDAQLSDRKALTLAAARKAVVAGLEEARKNNWTMVVAVVDDGGRVVSLDRMDKVLPASTEIAPEKGRSAVLFKRPTMVFEEGVKARPALVTVGATLLGGGIPLYAGGELIGGIGVSGGSPQQDEQVAKAAAAAIEGIDPVP